MTFKPGQSGNPSGRGKGTPNKRTQLAKLLEPHAESLIQKAVELALNGDTNALRLCLERLIPKASHESTGIDISYLDADKMNNLSALGKIIFDAVATGEVTPENGQIFSKMLENQRKLIEHSELKSKLEEIEHAIKRK